MPHIVTIEPNPDYKPAPADKAAFEAVKARGPVKTDISTAMDNMRRSKGMYRLATAAPVAEPASMVKRLEDHENSELVAMALGLGIKIEKQMKKSELVAFLQKKIDAVDIIDDDEPAAE